MINSCSQGKIFSVSHSFYQMSLRVSQSKVSSSSAFCFWQQVVGDAYRKAQE